MKLQKRTRTQWFALLGLIGIIFYFLHVIIGKLYYPGYDSLSQAVSDLTAANAPSKEIATTLATVNGFFTVTVCTLFCVFYQDQVNRLFRVGIYLFAAMQWISAVGYRLFSLSESGYAGAFQDKMHVVVTVLVVLLSIISMVLIAVGCFKSKVYRAFGTFTIVMLALMAIGSMGIGIVPPEYFGIAERFSVYAVILYTGALSIFTFRYKQSKPPVERVV